MSADKLTDIRCPTGSKSLLSRVTTLQGVPLKALGTFLLQHHCRECTRDFRRLHGADSVQRVLHNYTADGEFKYTIIQFKDGADKKVDPETQVKLFRLSTEFKHT